MRQPLVTERELLRGVRRLSSEALAEAYDRYSAELYAYAMRQLANPGLAEDCVAETYRRLLDAVQQGKGPRRHLRAYLYRTAHNWAIDNYRRPSTEVLDPANPTEDESAPTPDANLAAEADRARLLVAMEELTADQRQVLMLRFVEDWSLADTAQAMQRSVGAVKALQFRAIQALARAMGVGDQPS